MNVRRRVAAVTVLLAVLATPEAAMASGPVGVGGNVTITPAVLSLTISPATITNNHCWASTAGFDPESGLSNHSQPESGTTLTMPNGYCTAGGGFSQTNGGQVVLPGAPVTITMGGTAGHIDVQAGDGVTTNATGTNGTGTWNLVTGSIPGANQYTLTDLGNANLDPSVTSPVPNSVQLTGVAQCDTSFALSSGLPKANTCAAAAGQVGHEDIGLQGPASSSGTATNYGYTVTWTAVP